MPPSPGIFNCYVPSLSLVYPISSIYHVKGANVISPLKLKSFFLIQADGFQPLFLKGKKKKEIAFLATGHAEVENMSFSKGKASQ